MQEHGHVISHVHACVLPKQHGSLHDRVARNVSLNQIFFQRSKNKKLQEVHNLSNNRVISHVALCKSRNLHLFAYMVV